MPKIKVRGDHTSLIDLAEEILYILKKKDKDFSYSPGIIIRKNIKIKEVSIKIVEDTGSLQITFLMRNSKQIVRIYNLSKTDFLKYAKEYCDGKQISLK